MKFLRENSATFLTIALSAVTTLSVLSFSQGALRRQVDGNSSGLSDHEPRIRFMEVHGHEDHKRRISALENQKTDVMGEQLKTLASAVAKLAETVATDHDSVVKITALLERDSISKAEKR